ncbi:hypothetical protein V7796_30485 [Rhizobium laguerreae]
MALGVMSEKITFIAQIIAALWAINMEFIAHGVELGIGGVAEVRVEP